MMGTPCFTSPLCQQIYGLPYKHLVVKFRNPPFDRKGWKTAFPFLSRGKGDGVGWFLW